MELPLVLLVVLSTLLQPILQPRVADQSSKLSQKSGCAGFFGSHEKSGFKNTLVCTVMPCNVFSRMQSLCHGCEKSPHPSCGKRHFPEPFGSAEQGVCSDGEEKKVKPMEH